MARQRFTVSLNCPECHATGAVVWEENNKMSTSGLQRSLVEVQGAFHVEDGRTQSGDPVIVCNNCDTIQPD
jgi:hypothetical protein